VIKDFDAGLFARGIILRTRNQTFYVRAKVTKKYIVTSVEQKLKKLPLEAKVRLDIRST